MNERRAPVVEQVGRATVYTLPRLRDRRIVDLRERERKAWEVMLLIKWGHKV